MDEKIKVALEISLYHEILKPYFLPFFVVDEIKKIMEKTFGTKIGVREVFYPVAAVLLGTHNTYLAKEEIEFETYLYMEKRKADELAEKMLEKIDDKLSKLDLPVFSDFPPYPQKNVFIIRKVYALRLR